MNLFIKKKTQKMNVLLFFNPTRINKQEQVCYFLMLA